MRWLHILFCSLALSACDGGCPEHDGLDKIAEYRGLYPALPSDIWVANTQVSSFIRQAIIDEGVTALSAKYGMQCAPRKEAAGCSDCLSCTRTIKVYWTEARAAIPFTFSPYFYCVDTDRTFVHAEIGPRSDVKALTYHRKTTAETPPPLP
ncbi:MAG TPA: hypothetical protein VMI56_08080 [Reyranella sp.]|nr:hypothetical protein [Reyranella sp.]